MKRTYPFEDENNPGTSNGAKDPVRKNCQKSDVICTKCAQRGHERSNCPQNYFCGRCGKDGHLSKDCKIVQDSDDDEIEVIIPPAKPPPLVVDIPDDDSEEEDEIKIENESSKPKIVQNSVPDHPPLEDNPMPTTSKRIKFEHASSFKDTKLETASQSSNSNMISPPDSNQITNDDEIMFRVVRAEPPQNQLPGPSQNQQLNPPPSENQPGPSGNQPGPSKNVPTSSVNPEVLDLFETLVSMFPVTSPEFLREQAEELVGNPAAIDRFISDHLDRDSEPPENWKSKENDINMSNISTEENTPPPIMDNNEVAVNFLISIFPQVDPEFLQAKIIEFGDNELQKNAWVQETLENNLVNNLPTRAQYENRQKRAEEMRKYSDELTVQEILEMYDDDPESYFMDKRRQASPIYKVHCMEQLKKEFSKISVKVIKEIFSQNNCLFLPSVRDLEKHMQNKKNAKSLMKSKRKYDAANVPGEVDIEFLKELQYFRKEAEIQKFLDKDNSILNKKIQEAKENGTPLMECTCCYNDECFLEDMLPCKNGYLYCKDCVKRALEVAIGEGKTELQCLGHCQENFAMATLQKAIKANTFSKWIKQIQIAELEKADIEGLEKCPFCPFATIMDTTPEENKCFSCLNPECGKKSCRLCQESYHAPLRCDEVEKDEEVRKRTYIENKMTEAMIRKCWKCGKQFFKTQGCDHMTCTCGAQMCYVCQKPYVKHKDGNYWVRQCKCPPSDSNQLHDREVAHAAKKAKNEMNTQNPDVQLKHDPTINVLANNSNTGGNRNPNPGNDHRNNPGNHPVINQVIGGFHIGFRNLEINFNGILPGNNGFQMNFQPGHPNFQQIGAQLRDRLQERGIELNWNGQDGN